MGQLADVVIVSAFGRGDWLASELATQGWRVTLVDVSRRLGVWAPEDSEGPFGVFQVPELSTSQMERLRRAGHLQPIADGFCVWPPRGPLQTRSPLTAFQLRAHRVPVAVESYLRHQPGAPPEARSAVSCGFSGLSSRERHERRQIARLAYDENWLAQLAHQLAANVFRENHRAMEEGAALPLFAPYSLRWASRSEMQESLKDCQDKGVKVRSLAGVRDLRLNGRFVDAIEVEGDQSGIEKGRSFVWLLSSSETSRLPGATFGLLFPRGEVAPTWYWSRWQFDLTGRYRSDQLPLSIVAIQDLYLPWTHANCLVLRSRPETQSGSVKALDVWARLPVCMRASASELRKVQDAIEEVLRTRLPQSEPKLAVASPELRASVEALGPPRVPIYEEERLSRLRPLKSANLFLGGPEYWGTLDWVGMYRHQSQLLARLAKLKEQWDAAARNEALRSRVE